MPIESSTTEVTDSAAAKFDQIVKDVDREFAEIVSRSKKFIDESDERATRQIMLFKKAFNKDEKQSAGIPFDPAQASMGARIGAGNYGQINWLDTGQPDIGRLVAKTPLDGKSAEIGRQEIQQEYDYYQLAGDHPNLLKCHGMQKIDGKDALVLEGIQGRTMKSTLAILQSLSSSPSPDQLVETNQEYGRSKALSHEDAVGVTQYMAMELLNGLAHLEECGLVHNDIRPDNIMIDETTGAVKIVDLGNAQINNTAAQIRTAPRQDGTISPDRIRDEKITTAGDTFALGGTVYQAIEKEPFNYQQDRVNRLTSATIGQFRDPVAKKSNSEKEEVDPAPVSQQALPDQHGSKSFADTEYTQFVNLMMHPDPNKRPSAKALLATVHKLEQMPPKEMQEALAELKGTGIGFLVQRMIDPSRAQQVLKQALASDKRVQARRAEEKTRNPEEAKVMEALVLANTEYPVTDSED